MRARSTPYGRPVQRRRGPSRALALLSALGLLAACSTPRSPRPPQGVALAQAPYRRDVGSLVIRCGAVIDGVSDQASSEVRIVVRSGRIAEIGHGLEAPPDLPELDLHDYTCLPGLIDMHDHLTERSDDRTDMRAYLARSDAEHFSRARERATTTLLSGFTTVRNLGAYLAWSDRDLRDAIDRGEVIGPHMQVCGFYLTIPGGGGDLTAPNIPQAEIPNRFRIGIARGADQFRRKTEEAIAGGADVIKVIASGAVLAYGGVPGAPEMTPAELTAVVEVAHAAGRKVAAHAHGAQSIKDAIRAGADTIEHASMIDDEGLQLARERNVALSMDIYNGDYIATTGPAEGMPEEFLRKNIETTEVQRQSFTRAHARGVAIVNGTDAGVFPHGWNARQFPIMVARGMTPMEAIKAATSVSARYMGWGDRVGSLRPGHSADVIAVRGNPLTDIQLLQHVDVVIKDGLAFKLPARGTAPRR